jgi:hypothetical protein
MLFETPRTDQTFSRGTPKGESISSSSWIQADPMESSHSPFFFSLLTAPFPFTFFPGPGNAGERPGGSMGRAHAQKNVLFSFFFSFPIEQ